MTDRSYCHRCLDEYYFTLCNMYLYITMIDINLYLTSDYLVVLASVIICYFYQADVYCFTHTTIQINYVIFAQSAMYSSQVA